MVSSKRNPSSTSKNMAGVSNVVSTCPVIGKLIENKDSQLAWQYLLNSAKCEQSISVVPTYI